MPVSAVALMVRFFTPAGILTTEVVAAGASM